MYSFLPKSKTILKNDCEFPIKLSPHPPVASLGALAKETEDFLWAEYHHNNLAFRQLLSPFDK